MNCSIVSATGCCRAAFWDANDGQSILQPLVTGAAAAAWFYFSRPALPEGFAGGNGRLEANQVYVSAKYPGRIAQVLFNEGDTPGRRNALFRSADPGYTIPAVLSSFAVGQELYNAFKAGQNPTVNLATNGVDVEKLYPNVHVQYRPIGPGLPIALKAAVAAGHPPDMADLAQPGAVQELVDAGKLKPIDYANAAITLSRTVADIMLPYRTEDIAGRRGLLERAEAEYAQASDVVPATIPARESNARPADPSAPVVVEVRRQGEALRLSFPFATPTPAAVFRRADTIWRIRHGHASGRTRQAVRLASTGESRPINSFHAVGRTERRECCRGAAHHARARRRCVVRRRVGARREGPGENPCLHSRGPLR